MNFSDTQKSALVVKKEAQKALYKEWKSITVNPDKLIYAESDNKIVGCWSTKIKRKPRAAAVRPTENKVINTINELELYVQTVV